MMQGHVVFSILPYALIVGIATSVLASVLLIVNGFKERALEGGIYDRLSKIEADIMKDASQIEHQLTKRERSRVDPTQDAISDLSSIASDLQRQTREVQSILDDLRSTDRRGESVEASKKIARIDVGIGEAGSRVQRLLKRLESEKQIASNATTNTIGQS